MSFHCLRCKAELERSYRACPHCGESITDFMRTYADVPIDGKYRMVDRLGAGGMGEVYKAEHTFLGTMRVIKVIRPQISGSQDAHDRFLREARAATRVQHPNVATLHDFSSLPDGSHYMVWEFIDGENLAQRMRSRGPLPPRYAVQLIIEALRGLEAIHRAGIVHRDISPENLMLSRDAHGDERVKIIDLGVAKVDADEGADGATRAGIFVGKLRYASPEQLGFLEPGEKIDGRADLFAVGMVLYELVSGRPPFEATSPHEYVMIHAREKQVRSLELDALPGGPALQAVVEKALASDRSRRFATATEFADALEDVLRSLPDPRSIPTLAVPSPLDDDATMRVTPSPSARTVPSDLATAPTIRTPLPETPIPPQPQAAATVIDNYAAPAPRKRSITPIVAVLTVLIVLASGVAFVLRNRNGAPTRDVAGASAAGTTASASLDVAVPATAPPTATTATVTATAPVVQTAAPTPPPAEAKPGPAQPVEQPAPPAAPVQAVPEPETRVAAYVDGGGGDEDTNDAMLARLRSELQGVHAVTVRGAGEGQLHLARILRNEVSELEVGPGAAVEIDFEGTLRPLGRGRKERSATATIRKNGRTIFRYEMPPEVYRVGDTPPEAFARIVIDAFDR